MTVRSIEAWIPRKRARDLEVERSRFAGDKDGRLTRLFEQGVRSRIIRRVLIGVVLGVVMWIMTPRRAEALSQTR